MAFSQPVAFEVDAATGSDSNGGGFDDTSGAPGTNFAWGANRLATSISDLACTGAGSTFTSATLSALSGGAAACVGNVIKVSGGTNAVTGRYQILSQSAGTFTVDRSISTGAVSGGTGVLGGSLATQQEGVNAAFINAGAIADARVYIKKGAYTGTASLATSGSVAVNGYRNRVIGYNTSHDDDPSVLSGNQPTYAVGSGAGVNGLTISAHGYSIESVTFDGAATSGTRGTTGVSGSTFIQQYYNVRIKNFSSDGFNNSSQACRFYWGDITSCNSASGTASFVSNSALLAFSWIHLGSKHGVSGGGTLGEFTQIVGCVISNNTGSSSDGIAALFNTTILDTVIWGSGRHGISANTAQQIESQAGCLWVGNILAKNGQSGTGYGINCAAGAQPPRHLQHVDYNAFYSNATGNQNNINAGDHDQALSATPFVSSDSDLTSETSPNWSLNTDPNGGGKLRGAGFPSVANLSPVSFGDIGAYQHKDSGRGRNPLVVGMGAALQGGVY